MAVFELTVMKHNCLSAQPQSCQVWENCIVSMRGERPPENKTTVSVERLW